MKLAADIGNSRVKLGLFEGREMVCMEAFPLRATDSAIRWLEQQPLPERAIISSVANRKQAVYQYLTNLPDVMVFGPETPIPLKNAYLTPHSLGPDRLAAAVGAWQRFPGQNVLVVNAGTCITYELVLSNLTYAGGAIAPGLRMRLKAMHTFTSGLPLIELADPPENEGNDTRASLLAGAVGGAVREIEGTIARYERAYPGIRVIVSGGDLPVLVKHLKCRIFAVPNIVLAGLNEILDYNVR